jgi:hypothetical protein
MNTAIRIAIFAAVGWLAGEVISRTLLAAPAPAPAPSPRVPALVEPVARRSGWQEFLSTRTAPPAAASAPLTAAEVSAAPLGKIDGILAISRRLTTAPLEEFPGILDAVAAISDARLRPQAAEVLFAAWAEKDPLAAFAAVSTYPVIWEPALTGTVRTWAERDPRGLIAWLRSYEGSGGWNRHEAERFATPFLVAQCPEDTMALGLELRGSSVPGRRYFLSSAFVEWRERDRAAADAWSAYTPQNVRNQLAKALEEAKQPPLPAAPR